mgnify:CR=1 FL=1
MTVAAPNRAPISPLHGMLSRIELQPDARKLNLIVNHPDVYPWVRGPAQGELDITPAFERGDVLCLLAEHGGILFQMLQPGLYEAHTQVLPEGRGAWAVRCVSACLHWLFTHTDAIEVVTKCPEGNLASKGLARAIHGRYQFTNPKGWVMDDKPIPADIYSLTVQDWMRTAPGLVDRGKWFHERLKAEFERHGVAEQSHAEDPTHDRYVGAACEMILGGQPEKAAIFFNRYAVMGGYAPVEIVSLEPMAFNIGNATVVVRGDEFWVPKLRPLH